tara:strand:+ start:172 stop:1149 length:978 start_codon:yes stop_codon:yes gene_type:complete
MNKILITGCAGFIGFHYCRRLINEGYFVVGLDNLNNYYDINLKRSRLKILEESEKKENFKFIKADIVEIDKLKVIFKEEKPEIVINFAAQAGVRYSITNPEDYAKTNLLGFFNILECCKNNDIKNLIYASSSSVYGGNKILPFSEEDKVDKPVSFYAATKKANELMAESYNSLYRFSCIGLRFFTVYGEWGRPDMAPMIFANAIQNNQTLKIFNNGKCFRDFTYIDDVIESIFKLMEKIYDSNDNSHHIFNVGNSKKIELMKFINLLEDAFKKKARKKFLPLQQGDVESTFSDCTKLEKFISYKPNTNLKKGIRNFSKWYLEYQN